MIERTEQKTVRRAIARVDDPVPMQRSAIHVAKAIVPPGEWRRHDPFLSMMNDVFKRGAFGPHPHRGFETITYVLDGQLQHEDNQGCGGILGPGDAQWMTAGRGVIHNESPVGEGAVHVLQLWLNLPARDKLAPFRYQDLRGESLPVRRESGVEVRVFSGRSGDVVGPAENYVPVTLLEIRMAAGARFSQTLPAADNGFVYVISGTGRFGRNGTPGGVDQALWLERSADESQFDITADSDLRCLLFAGQPLDEPVAAQGPFVMNTPKQIAEAMVDYRNGGFGPPL